mgnify:CR=1 FL=1
MASRRSSTQFPFTPMRVVEAPGAYAAKRGWAAAFQVACLERWAICAARSGCTASSAGASAGAEKDRAREESSIEQTDTEPPGAAAAATAERGHASGRPFSQINSQKPSAG